MKTYLAFFIIALTPLSLHAETYTADAIRFLSTVYRHHPTLVSERLKTQQTQLRITEAEGLYDTTITGRVNRQKDAATYFSQTGQIISKETTTLQAGLSQKLSSGADIGLGVQSTQQDNNGTTYSSRLSLDVTQPLLNGFGQLPTEMSIMTAKLTVEKNKYTYNSILANTLQDAFNTYTQYITAWQKQRIYEDDIALSQYLLSQIKRKKSLDLSDNLALLDAEIQLATVEDQQRSSAHDYASLAESLHRITGKTWTPSASETTVSLTSMPLQTAISLALANNPDLLAINIALEQQRLTLQLKENNTLPVLDLSGSLGYNKSGSDWQQSIQFQDPSFAIGLSTSFPWGNREANAQLASEKLALQDLENQRQEHQEKLSQQLTESYRDVSLKKDRVQHYQNILVLANKKLSMEKKKFELGLSLVDTLLEAQKYKTDTAIQAAAAELAYLQACLHRDSLLGDLSSWVGL